MKIVLQKAQNTDKSFLLKLRKSTMENHLKKAKIYLTNNEHKDRVEEFFECAYLIKLSKQKVGLLKYQETEKTLEIIQLQVLPKYQNRGIGKHLLNHLSLIAKKFAKNT